MNIAVVDGGGNLVSHVRMDGAWIGSIEISIDKAFTARAFDISTAELSKNAQPGQQFYGIHNSNHGRIMIFAGGVPLRRDGSVAGAIALAAYSWVVCISLEKLMVSSWIATLAAIVVWFGIAFGVSAVLFDTP
jgi:Haem degrading protein HbpS-like